MAKRDGLSVNQRKVKALRAIQSVDYEPPKYAIAQLMGINRETLRTWEKKDKQFNDELEHILLEKRTKLVGKAHEGLTRCIEDNHYPAIKDTLRIQDPDNWAEPEVANTTTVNIMYLNLPRPDSNGKPKKVTNGKHRLK